MGVLQSAWEFLWAVLFNWKGLAAGLLFMAVSLLHLLPEERRARLDARFPPEARRKLLVATCGFLFVIASFQAYDEKSRDVSVLRDKIAGMERQSRNPNALYQGGREVALIAGERSMVPKGP